MTEIRKQTEKISMGKTVTGIIAAIFILIAAQSLALSIGEVPLNLGVSGAACNVVISILYIGFALGGTALLCRKYFGCRMTAMRMPGLRVKLIWAAAAVLMPAAVLVICMMTGGHWEVNTFSAEDTALILTSGILFYGLAAGTVEEMVFRGLIMGILERRFGIRAAVIVPSVLFGALHIIGSDMDFVSTVQPLIAGSIVGILFSLIAYESGSVWNSAMVHGVWNMAVIGGILHIGSSAEESAVFNFVLDNKGFLVSGGNYGIEASAVAAAVYLIAALAAFGRVKRARK